MSKVLSYSFWCVSECFFAAIQAFHYPALASLLSKKLSEKSGRSRTYTTVMAGTATGNVLSGSVGSLLLATYGWHSVFYTFGTLSVIWALLVKFCLIKGKKDDTKQSNGQLSKPVNQKVLMKDVPWKVLLTHSAFWALILGRFCLNYVFHLLFSWLPTYFSEKFPDENGYVFNVIPWLLCVPSSILSGFIADKIISSGYSVTVARKCLHTLECSGVVVCLIAISMAETFYTAVVCATAALIFQSFGLAGVFANAQDIAPDFAGAVFGLMNTAGAIPGFIGVYAAGHLLEYLHSWPAVFCSTACISFIGWFIFFIFGTGKKIV
ncbi:voltage-gated purine nucleotide uniporter SLC17A9-like [Ptychodera flava]|uniref:voltage-gated purine nucleotide uniporter SLC17A9-like n=1 Tax=Ptychodera flava TaxID=63121 RepID=UPI003969D6FE